MIGPRAVTIVLVAATGLIVACDQPLPKITVLGGGRVITVAPSTYCFDATHCRTPGAVALAVVTVAPDDKVLVDVPRAVKGQGWQVRALSLTDQGKDLGSSGPITDSHSYQVASGVSGGSPFIVEVDQLRGGRPDASKWSFLVSVSATAS